MVSGHHIRLIQVSNFLDLNIFAKTPWGPIVYVKVSNSVDMFKCNLEAYKLSSMGDRFLVSTNCFWEVSEHVLNRNETPAALAGRSALCE